MTDQQHIRKIMQMPVHFLLESGKGFFVEKEGCALALKEEMRDVIGLPGFAEQMGMRYGSGRWIILGEGILIFWIIKSTLPIGLGEDTCCNE